MWSLFSCCSEGIEFAFFRGVAQQLLALGYGRREVNSTSRYCIPIPDEHLDATRCAIRLRWNHQAGHNSKEVHDHSTMSKGVKMVADELKTLVESFDAGPLSLRHPPRSWRGALRSQNEDAHCSSPAPSLSLHSRSNRTAALVSRPRDMLTEMYYAN